MAKTIESNNQVRYELSAAIDFGTSNCAIAYSYDYEKDEIYCLKDWPDGSKEEKIPTAILFNKNKKFEKFGHGAIEKYQELVADEKHEDYYFFKNFKMTLYNEQNISKETMLTDVSGKKMKAIDVFIASIKFLKSQLIKSINEKQPHQTFTENIINWVLTIPAIWSDAAKQFMREAAEKTGCRYRSLLIALEPEAASIYCRTAPKEKMKFHADFKKEDAKYLVLDIGGGTIDVTAHELNKDNCIKEIFRATGGAWGGEKVDQLFEEFLEFLFSKKNIQKIKKDHQNEWIQVIQDFKKIKRELRPDNTETSFSINLSQDCPWDKHHFKKLSDKKRKGTKFKDSRLIFKKSILLDMIKQVSMHVKNHTKTLLQKQELKDLDFIMMVGGFSNRMSWLMISSN